MNYGGDAADQIVRYSLEGIDYSLRLSGTVDEKPCHIFCGGIKGSEADLWKDTHGADAEGEPPIEILYCAVRPSERICP